MTEEQRPDETTEDVEGHGPAFEPALEPERTDEGDDVEAHGPTFDPAFGPTLGREDEPDDAATRGKL
jgi:hypothetical protein